MIAISFLGIGKYQGINYTFSGKSSFTKFFPFAIKEIFEPEELKILFTKESKEEYGEQLKETCDFEEIMIPSGKTEDEMWRIFLAMADSVKEGDEIIFDVTHGFRSQPLFAMSAMIFLQNVKNAKIIHILYGAYDAREDNKAPIYDLKPFMDLIEWSYGARDFIKKGDMSGFNNILNEIHKKSYLDKSLKGAKSLKSAGTNLSNLTNAFNTIRLEEIIKYSKNFLNQLPDLEVDFENHISSKPLSYVVKKIKEKVETIVPEDGELFSDRGFEAQKEIIKWYLDTQQWQKALTLMQEYIKSFSMMRKGLNTQEIANREKRDDHFITDSKLEELYKSCSNFRNDVNHAGMRKGAASSNKIIENTKKLAEKIFRLDYAPQPL